MLVIFLLGLIAAAAEILGGTLVTLRKEWPKAIQEYLIALSAGFILALAFFDLIPESLEQLGASASLYMVIGFGILHFFEHTIVGHFHFGEETHHDVMISNTACLSAISGLLIHAFFDGLSISAGLQFDFTLGLLIFIAILLHKIPEGLTVASIMLAAKRSKKSALIATFAVGTATMLGVVLVFIFSGFNEKFIGITFSISAGAALYVGGSDLIPEINRSENRITPLVVFGGMILFYFSEKLLHYLIG